MKTLTIAFLALLSVFCTSCADLADLRPRPSPVRPAGPWLVREQDETGKTLKEWETAAFKTTILPPTVQFVDSNGTPHRLTGSFEIVKKP